MFPTFESVALFTAAVIIGIFLLELQLHWKRRPFVRSLKSIPEPDKARLPILGHVKLFSGGPTKIIDNLAKHYAVLRTKNFKFWMFHRMYLVLTKAEDIALTIGSPNFLAKTVDYTLLAESILGGSIFAITDVADWKRKKLHIKPPFVLQVLKSYIHNFYEEAKTLAEKLTQRMDKNGEVEIFHPIGLYTMDAVTKTSFGVSINAQDNNDHVIVNGLETVLSVWHDRIFKPWYLNRYIFNLSSLKTRHDEAMHAIQSFASEVILIRLEERLAKLSDANQHTQDATSTGNGEKDDDDEYRSTNTKAFLDYLIEYGYSGVSEYDLKKSIEDLRKIINNGRKANINNETTIQNKTHSYSSSGMCIQSGSSYPEILLKVYNNLNVKNLITRLMNTVGSKDGVNDNNFHTDERLKISELQQLNRQLRDDVIGIITGGQEPTASSITFTVLMLAMHPEVQKKVAIELDEIFNGDSRAPRFEDLQKMEYLECVLKETLRLYPTLPIIARVADKDTTLSDKSVIPKGCLVAYYVYGLHRDSQYFHDPDKFIPERFLPENSHDRHPYSFIPFSAGARTCTGRRYVMFEMKVALSTLVREFKISTSERLPTMDHIRLQIGTTLRPQDGCWVKLEKRSNLLD